MLPDEITDARGAIIFNRNPEIGVQQLTKADKIQILQEKVVALNEKIEQLNGMKRQIEKFMGEVDNQ
jgi:hypothetical protein